jgi:hypothetical protein
LPSTLLLLLLLSQCAQLDVASQFHHTFLMGDLNYRLDLNLPAEQQFARALQLIALQDWSELNKHDELAQELSSGALLAGFRTEPPQFAPTFKLLRGAVSAAAATLNGSSGTAASGSGTAEVVLPVPSEYDPRRTPSYTDRYNCIVQLHSFEVMYAAC